MQCRIGMIHHFAHADTRHEPLHLQLLVPKREGNLAPPIFPGRRQPRLKCVILVQCPRSAHRKPQTIPERTVQAQSHAAAVEPRDRLRLHLFAAQFQLAPNRKTTAKRMVEPHPQRRNVPVTTRVAIIPPLASAHLARKPPARGKPPRPVKSPAQPRLRALMRQPMPIRTGLNPPEPALRRRLITKAKVKNVAVECRSAILIRRDPPRPVKRSASAQGVLSKHRPAKAQPLARGAPLACWHRKRNAQNIDADSIRSRVDIRIRKQRCKARELQSARTPPCRARPQRHASRPGLTPPPPKSVNPPAPLGPCPVPPEAPPIPP